MAAIILTNVEVKNNPAKFTDAFVFDITFETIAPGIKEELEWTLTYVGSADDSDCDQKLDNVFVGPVSVGKNKFTFSAPAPNFSKIPRKDILGVTVILLTCSYNGSEFIRVGYYINNEYIGELPILPGSSEKGKKAEPIVEEPAGEEQAVQMEEAPGDRELDGEEKNEELSEKEVEQLPNYDLSKIEVVNLRRNILADEPRVTKFQISWDEDTAKSSEDTPNAMVVDTS